MLMGWHPETRERLTDNLPVGSRQFRRTDDIGELNGTGPKIWKRNQEAVWQQFLGYVLTRTGPLDEVVLMT